MSIKSGKEKHPLFNSWAHYKRKGVLIDGWKDFYAFVDDIGERKAGHRLVLNTDRGIVSWKWVEIKQRLKDYESKAAYHREYMKRNPDKQKSMDLKKNFGITLETYKSKSEQQQGLCAICNKPEITKDNRTGLVRNLAVDHNHNTGQVRGLLCRGCNQGLGNFQEDLQRLKNAVAYLKSFDLKDVPSNI